MKRLPAALAAIAFVSAGVLTGCSGGDGSDYCNRVRDNADSDTLDNLDPSDPDALKTFISEAKKLQADAPDEVKDDYDSVIAAFEDPTSADAAKVGDAVEAIQAYDEDNCDVEYQSS
jgi:hypothetical protein